MYNLIIAKDSKKKSNQGALRETSITYLCNHCLFSSLSISSISTTICHCRTLMEVGPIPTWAHWAGKSKATERINWLMWRINRHLRRPLFAILSWYIILRIQFVFGVVCIILHIYKVIFATGICFRVFFCFYKKTSKLIFCSIYTSHGN